jgi:hypothetical protein
MHAASIDRILTGSGLTYANAEAYSEENWIRMNKEKDNGTDRS